MTDRQHRANHGMLHRVLLAVGALLACTYALAASPVSDPGSFIVVAVSDRPPPTLGVGSTPRGYAGGASYVGSQAAQALASEVANDHQLQEQSAWTIRALDLRCMLYRLSDGAKQQSVLEHLRADPRVQLAEPLRMFHTLAAPHPATPTAAANYNDPYVNLQRGFSSIHAGAAQQWSQGAGVHIALIDTGVDVDHPDLAGRIDAAGDFVGDSAGADAAERHGTEIAGVIVANANNHLGIVGIAPRAIIDVYRACWPITSNSAQSTCSSFTLAQALGAAIDADADIINLSLGGPADPLLALLVRKAIARGAIVIAAAPSDEHRDGFPASINAVITVAAATVTDDAMHTLSAPGTEVLTTEPGQRFDFASGSSIAAAHVSGVVALMLSLDPDLSTSAIRALLQASMLTQQGNSIDACRAVAKLRKTSMVACTGDW